MSGLHTHVHLLLQQFQHLPSLAPLLFKFPLASKYNVFHSELVKVRQRREGCCQCWLFQMDSYLRIVDFQGCVVSWGQR